ncbi:hypothetical protein M409DRAFT_30548 [Zasmidium cellare ATCC 36951]|uniref:Uncharacterized protein n=1 Tax=Zasmidium cellare ATCC 36951 TaxID=1080233 RepID=A0A6A6BWP7_ZASCE|nr:uncharacterized protein M409DRAFT_30548 [Zasmidium cellare ATCC 36951]KAF2159013.1 hypothetical protein M409DRAFT_30548 [Zasmidium cellare ATCC 36951]
MCPELFAERRPNLNVNSPISAEKSAWEFVAGTFVHELLHVISDDFNDRVFTDPNGVRTLPHGPLAIFAIPNQIGASGGKVWKANIGAVTTINQPSGYQIFSEECQYPGTKWSVDQQQ